MWSTRTTSQRVSRHSRLRHQGSNSRRCSWTELASTHRAEMGEEGEGTGAGRQRSPRAAEEQRRATQLDDLDDDLLCRILLSAGGAEASASLTATCRQFRALGCHPTLWTTHARRVAEIRLLLASQQPTALRPERTELPAGANPKP
jgi:hypothetical protein